MSTPDARPIDPRDPAGPAHDAGLGLLLPDLALVTAIANELFHELPGRLAAAQAAGGPHPAAPALPTSAAALPQPPAPAGVPTAPPTTSASPGASPVPALAPTAAPTAPPVPMRAVPWLPPAAPAGGPTAAVPGVLSETELRALPASVAAVTGLGLLGGLGEPPAPHAATPRTEAWTLPPTDALPSVPSNGPAPAVDSPVPVPTAEQLAGVATSLGDVMVVAAGLPSADLAVAPQDAPVRAPALTAPATGHAESWGALDQVTSAATTGLPANLLVLEPVRPELLPQEDVRGRGFDPHRVRADFPILAERVHGRPLVWLDNAATTQKPRAVIDRLARYYEHENSNVHRAAHTLAARSTDAYEAAREKVRRFLNAGSVDDVVFVRGTTEGINLVAAAWGPAHVTAGDEVLVTHLEHHANIVPWQQLCARVGAVLRVAPVDGSGQVILSEYERLVGPRTRLVAFTQVSNALGTVTPAAEMIEIAHRRGARVLLDGAQSVSHLPVDVQALGCDFFVFSGHKVFGPTGIGVLYGTPEALAETPPWQGGGNMIVDVTFERTIYQPPPARFEAGTGNIADAVGLGAALDYVTELGRESIAAYEHDLLQYGTELLLSVPGLRLVGTAQEKAAVLSFVLDGFRTEDVGAALDREGIAVRSGHHCAQPILRRFGLEATVRPSLALYNTHEDLDALLAALLRIRAGDRRTSL